MEEKVLLQDLAKLLSAEKSIDKKAAMDFTQIFFDMILRGIQRDKYVKIKGLGTFKQVEVESRESMNIHTGERFLIDGHVKISFTPDQALKDAVNKPFAHFETVELSDEVSDLELKEIDEQFSNVEDEIVEEVKNELPAPQVELDPITVNPAFEDPILEALVPTVELSPEEVTPEVEKEQNPIEEVSIQETVLEPQPAAEENIPVVEEIPEPIIQEPTAGPEHKSEEPVLVKLVDPVTINQKVEISNNRKEEGHSKKHSRYYTLLVVALVLIALGIGYFMGALNMRSVKPTEVITYVHDTIVVEKSTPVQDTTRVDSVPVVKKDLTTPPVNKPQVEKATVKKKEEKPLQKVEQKPQVSTSNKDKYPQVAGGGYWIVGTAQTYTIRKGETIRLIAERFFGSRQMAPYIIRYNGVSDPDHVAEGTVLNIPKLESKRK